jgi:hypothetical protein
MLGLHESDLKTSVVYASIAALLWVSLYHLNTWVFASFQVNEYVCWIFLPAAARLLTVLVMGLPAALGLLLGTFITCNPVFGVNAIESLEIATLSAFGPVLAVIVCIKVLYLPNDLRGLHAKHLAVFSLIGGAFNVIPHAVLFFQLHKISEFYEPAISMFAGDVTGTWIVLVIAAWLIRLLPDVPKSD